MHSDSSENTRGAHRGARDPLQLGPYVIEHRLGQGGMGTVYAAWDKRLERRVALKLIRAESADSPDARERFRREARAAAALNHPAVVQVYDVLDTEHGDAIVMEYVEGYTLAELLHARRPPPETALALAAQIAGGLAAAHAHGIVHRDLKTENVMVTLGGHAKVLDFGLARRAQAGDASATSGVVGTYRAMSPEQARALPVDHRSDLFSFGTLLYELFTGRSPFAAASALETLTNVCRHTPPPLRDGPPALAALVEGLLQKEPGRRPQDTVEVAETLRRLLDASGHGSGAARHVSAWARAAEPAARSHSAVDAPDWLPTLGRVEAASAHAQAPRPRRLLPAVGLALLAVAALWLASRTRDATRLSVAVPRAQLEGVASPTTETLRAGARTALLRGLLSFAGISPVAPDVLDPVPGSVLDAARAVAADELLTAHVACASEACRVTLTRLTGRDGALLWTTSFETPAHEPGLLPEVVLGHLRRAYPERALRARVRPIEVSPADFTEYLALQRSFDSRGREGTPLAELDTRLRALRARAPRFIEAGVFEAELLRRRFLDSRERAHLAQAAAVLERLRELAPDDPRLLGLTFEVALTSEDLDGAERALDALERVEPGDPGLLMQRARLLLRRKADPARTLALARTAVERQPSYLHLLRAAQIENRLGGAAGTQAARAHLHELLRRYPTHDGAQSTLAEIELLKGNPERAAELYAELAQRAPRLIVLANLGVARLLLARHAQAEEALRQATRIEPANAVVALNLADVVLLQGRRDEARALYRGVLELAAADAAPTGWQMLSVAAQAHAHLGARLEAAEALQRMLGAAGDNPQAALEAAVTYAVLGERTSALASAARAMRGGVEPRWLCLPWFDPLRDDAQWHTLLPVNEPCTPRAGSPAAPGNS